MDPNIGQEKKQMPTQDEIKDMIEIIENPERRSQLTTAQQEAIEEGRKAYRADVSAKVLKKIVERKSKISNSTSWNPKRIKERQILQQAMNKDV
jgi:hypothetical protein